ncbi:MAG: helix-turn-helix transcriptional regulator [Candidatus Brocadiia bacterium]
MQEQYTTTVHEPTLVWGDRAKVEQTEALENYRAVPLMGSAAAAGHGRVIDEEIESWAIIHESIVPEGHEVRAVRVEGDSMEPLLPEGTIIAVDCSVNDPASVDGHIALAQRDSEVVIKWWMCHDHCVTLESENSTYGAIVLEPGEEEHALIGKVVWAWQDLRDLRRHK